MIQVENKIEEITSEDNHSAFIQMLVAVTILVSLVDCAFLVKLFYEKNKNTTAAVNDFC